MGALKPRFGSRQNDSGSRWTASSRKISLLRLKECLRDAGILKANSITSRSSNGLLTSRPWTMLIRSTFTNESLGK